MARGAALRTNQHGSPLRARISAVGGTHIRRTRSLLLLATLLTTGTLVLASGARADAGAFSNPALINCGAFASSKNRNQASISSESSVVWRELKVDDWLIVPNVCPQLHYFPSGLILTPGATYQISAQGDWKDGILPPTGPEGWHGLLIEAFNRIPWRRMASLSASVGRNEKLLRTIGGQQLLTTPPELTDVDDRRLYLFANDWPWPYFYNNNSDLDPSRGGPMRVSIHRLS